MKLPFTGQVIPSLRIVAMCMAAGPLIGVLTLYLVFLGVAAWAGVQAVLSPIPAKGGPMLSLVLVALLALLPVFAIVGIAAVALQTFLTGVLLSVAHTLKVPELLVRLLPALPNTVSRLVVASLVGFGVSFLVSPSEAPKQLRELGPLSLQFAAAVSAGVCYVAAIWWSQFEPLQPASARAAQDGA